MTVRLAEPPPANRPGSPNRFIDPLHNKAYYSFYPSEVWTPNVNLYETETAYVVCVDLSGVDKAKIDIEVAGDRLTLHGNRTVPAWEPPPGYPNGRVRVHLMEIDHGTFAREVELPNNVQRENISAKYKEGMLWIELPKSV